MIIIIKHYCFVATVDRNVESIRELPGLQNPRIADHVRKKNSRYPCNLTANTDLGRASRPNNAGQNNTKNTICITQVKISHYVYNTKKTQIKEINSKKHKKNTKEILEQTQTSDRAKVCTYLEFGKNLKNKQKPKKFCNNP